MSNDELESFLSNLERMEMDLGKCQSEYGNHLTRFITDLEAPSRQLAEKLLGANFISTDTYFTINRNIDHLKQICEGMTSCQDEQEYMKATTLINHKLGLLKLNLANASEFGKKASEYRV